MLLVNKDNLWLIAGDMCFGEQGWRSGESARLPPMCPGFGSQTRRHMWVEFVLGSLLCSMRFFSGYSSLPHFSKTNISKFQFDPRMHGHFWTSSRLWTPWCSVGKQITPTQTADCNTSYCRSPATVHNTLQWYKGDIMLHVSTHLSPWSNADQCWIVWAITCRYAGNMGTMSTWSTMTGT